MLRAALLLLLSAPIATVAAPVPAPTEKEQIARLWGKIVAPSDNYEFKLDGKLLTIRTVGQPTRGVFHGDNCTMPRVTRTVTGDFEATVKVVTATPPNRNLRHEEGWPGTRAGLFVSGGGSAIEFHLFQYHQKLNGVTQEKLSQYLWLDNWYPGGGNGSTLQQVDTTQSIYLKVTRKDNVTTVSHSFDNKDWAAPRPTRKLDFPDDVTVGVFFSQTTWQVADATFEGFTIAKPK